MNYFLAPRSGEKSYKNFKSTIRNGIPYERIEDYLSTEGKEKLLKEDVIYAWGNREGTRSQWKMMEPGDIVIFYASKELVMVGTMYHKEYSKEMALAMWPPDEKGNPWAYTFFLRDLKYIRIPIRAFNAIAGYKPANIIQGFMRIKDDHRKLIETQYGSVEKMIEAFSDDDSVEAPKADEKIYVNVEPEVKVTYREDISLIPKSKLLKEKLVSIKGAKKIDYVAKSKSSAITGSKGEQLVLREEQKRLALLGREDLVKQIDRVSLEDDTLGYDVLSYEKNGKKRYIEVKTSGSQTKNIRFYLSSNEFEKSKALDNYYIYFVDGVNTKSPRITPIRDPFTGGKFLISTDTYVVEAELE